MASKVVTKKEEVAGGAGPSNDAAAEPSTIVEATHARLLELTRELPKLTEKVLVSDPVISKIPKLELVSILNALIKLGKMKIQLDKNCTPFFKLVTVIPATVLRAATDAIPEEKLLLKMIEEAGSTGIWTKEMRTKSGLTQLTLNKILKTMESKKLIKSATLVKTFKKKLFLLYDVTPDSSVIGGSSGPGGIFDGSKNDIDESSASGQPSKRYKMTDSLIPSYEKLLLKIIEEAGSKGIWTKEMLTKSGLTKLELPEVLKSMESKNIIKSVTSVKASKKKMFFLYDVTPVLTGGPSGPNGTFDGSRNGIEGSSAGDQPSMTESPSPSAGFVDIPCSVDPINLCS